MLTILSCDCGHRFEIGEPPGSQVPCPRCGQNLSVPGTPPVTLRMEQYMAQAAASGLGDSGAPVREVSCPDCRGSGVCAVCRGRGLMGNQGFFRLVGGVLLFLLFGIWGLFFRSLFDVPTNVHASLGTDGCLKCLGRGLCHRCRGAGKLLVRLS